MKAIFLRWWLFIILSIVATVFSWQLGFVQEVYSKDATPICVTIFVSYWIMSAWCGIKTWRISSGLGKEDPKKIIDDTGRQQEIGWFVSDQFLTLGLIGTIWGFILMAPDFAAIDVGKVESLKSFIITMASGLGTALYTTLIGLICSGLLRVQYFNLSQTVDYAKKLRKANVKKKNLSLEQSVS
jgi:hypothetical protein